MTRLLAVLASTISLAATAAEVQAPATTQEARAPNGSEAFAAFALLPAIGVDLSSNRALAARFGTAMIRGTARAASVMGSTVDFRLFAPDFSRIDGWSLATSLMGGAQLGWFSLEVALGGGYARGSGRHFGFASLEARVAFGPVEVGYAFEPPLFTATPGWFAVHAITLRLAPKVIVRSEVVAGPFL